MKNEKRQESVAPMPKPFGNLITSSILAIIIGLWVIGLFLIFLGLYTGVLVAWLGIFLFVVGYTDIPANPRTAAALTFWGSFIKLGGKPVVVGGKTVLANYFPFFISGEQFNITNVDKDITMTVTSKDKVPLEGVVSVTLYPDIDDAIDYIQAGGDIMKIIAQLDDIVKKRAREVAADEDALDITQKSEKISGKLLSHVTDKLEERAFGVKVLKVQAIFDQPADVLLAMKGKRIEKYQRENEHYEYETNIEAAKKLQTMYRNDPAMKGRVPTLEACLEQILTQRLIRDGRAQEIKSKGGKIFNIAQANNPPTTS